MQPIILFYFFFIFNIFSFLIFSFPVWEYKPSIPHFVFHFMFHKSQYVMCLFFFHFKF